MLLQLLNNSMIQLNKEQLSIEPDNPQIMLTLCYSKHKHFNKLQMLWLMMQILMSVLLKLPPHKHLSLSQMLTVQSMQSRQFFLVQSKQLERQKKWQIMKQQMLLLMKLRTKLESLKASSEKFNPVRQLYSSKLLQQKQDKLTLKIQDQMQ